MRSYLSRLAVAAACATATGRSPRAPAMASAASRSDWSVRSSRMPIDCSRSKTPTSTCTQPAPSQSARLVVVTRTRRPTPRGIRDFRSSGLSTSSNTIRRFDSCAEASAVRQRCAINSSEGLSSTSTPSPRTSSASPERTASREPADIQATNGHPSASQRAATAVASCDFPLPRMPVSTVRPEAPERTVSNSPSCSRLSTNPDTSMGRLPNRIREGRRGTGLDSAPSSRSKRPSK